MNGKNYFNVESLIYLIKTFSIALVTFYIFYIFDDDFWLYKVIITLLFIKFFSSLGNHPGRSLKVYYPLMLILNLTILQWTNELLTVSIIAASVYYFFDAFSYSMLGSSGLYILGLISGLVYSEAIVVNMNLYIFSIILLIAACLILNIKLLSNKFCSIGFFKDFDRLLVSGEDDLSSISIGTQLESHKTNIEQDSAIHTE
jgi:hypothetical protein